MKRNKWVFLILAAIPVFAAVALASGSSKRNHRIEDLEYALGNEDVNVRLAAVAELVEYEEDGVPSLRKALKDKDPAVKRAAIEALATIKGQASADALADILSDPDRTIRVRGIVALAVTGRAALPHLYKALESEPYPNGRMFAANGIAHLAEPGDTPEIMKRFDRQLYAAQMHLVLALVRIDDDEAYAGLGRLMQSPDQLIRFYVANTIAEGHPNRKALPVLLTGLGDSAQEVRMWSMFGIEKLNVPETYPHVVRALNDENGYVRKEAAFTLGDLGNPDAVPHLIAKLDTDTHAFVRANAALSLGKLGDASAVPILKKRLADDVEPVRIRSAEALTRFNDFSGVETLIDLIQSPTYLYRLYARKALRGISNQDFGYDYEAWSGWWREAKNGMTTSQPGIPEG